MKKFWPRLAASPARWPPRPSPAIVVTDEVGAGIVPENAMARRFRDLLGWTNQALAQTAERVVLMVAGYPMRVK